MVVPVDTGPTFTAGEPEVPFNDRYFLYLSRRTYDVAPDGQRFLMVSTADEGGDATRIRMRLIQNWFEELKRVVPTNN